MEELLFINENSNMEELLLQQKLLKSYLLYVEQKILIRQINDIKEFGSCIKYLKNKLNQNEFKQNIC